MYSNFAITNTIIFNSFKYSSISNSSDGSEDDNFRVYEDREKGNEINQFENNVKLYLDDDYETSSESDE